MIVAPLWQVQMTPQPYQHKALVKNQGKEDEERTDLTPSLPSTWEALSRPSRGESQSWMMLLPHTPELEHIVTKEAITEGVWKQ